MGVLLDILGGIGNTLDVPGSMVRDTLGGENPFDQLMTPWSAKRRLTGRDLNRRWGLAGEQDTGLNAAGGMATEVTGLLEQQISMNYRVPNHGSIYRNCNRVVCNSCKSACRSPPQQEPGR